MPDTVWASAASLGLMLLVGLIGFIAAQPLLFPSLAPTAYLQSKYPRASQSRLYNVIVGHLVGLVAGLLAVVILGAALAPPLPSTQVVTPVRIVAAALAVASTVLIASLLHASHPPAASTAALVALGAFQANLEDALTVVAGVLIVGVVGEGVRRLRLGELRLPKH